MLRDAPPGAISLERLAERRKVALELLQQKIARVSRQRGLTYATPADLRAAGFTPTEVNAAEALAAAQASLQQQPAWPATVTQAVVAIAAVKLARRGEIRRKAELLRAERALEAKRRARQAEIVASSPAPVVAAEDEHSARWWEIERAIAVSPALAVVRWRPGEPDVTQRELELLGVRQAPMTSELHAPAPAVAARTTARVVRLPVVQSRAVALERRRWTKAETVKVQLRELGVPYTKWKREGLLQPVQEKADAELLERFPRPRNARECRPGAPGRWWGKAACPYISCRQHLGLTVTEAGGVKLLTGLDDGRGSCALDLAGEGARTLEEVGEVLGVSRQRMEQTEKEIGRKNRALAELFKLYTE